MTIIIRVILWIYFWWWYSQIIWSEESPNESKRVRERERWNEESLLPKRGILYVEIMRDESNVLSSTHRNPSDRRRCWCRHRLSLPLAVRNWIVSVGSSLPRNRESRGRFKRMDTLSRYLSLSHKPKHTLVQIPKSFPIWAFSSYSFVPFHFGSSNQKDTRSDVGKTLAALKLQIVVVTSFTLVW